MLALDGGAIGMGRDVHFQPQDLRTTSCAEASLTGWKFGVRPSYGLINGEVSEFA